MVWKTTVHHQDARTQIYVGTPSVERLSDGRILVSHDHWGPGSICGDRFDRDNSLTMVYESLDNGESFSLLTYLYNMCWGQMFHCGGALYMIGTTRSWGSIVIRRSDDGGYTWTYPRNDKTGILFPAGDGRQNPPNYHRNMPVIEHNGRLYAMVDVCQSTEGVLKMASAVISCDADADLLDASHWCMSDPLPFSDEWIPQSWLDRAAKMEGWTSDPVGWLNEHATWHEGNVVVAPNGELYDIARVSSEPLTDLAAVLHIHDEGRRISFSPDDFIDLPGGTHKFVVKHDAVSGLYWTLSNKNTVPGAAWQRNVLVLCNSQNLRDWTIVKVVLEDDQDIPFAESLNHTSFSYVDWIIDGEDILMAIRSGYGKSKSFHDTNYIAFHRVENFRQYRKACSLDCRETKMSSEDSTRATNEIHRMNEDKKG